MGSDRKHVSLRRSSCRVAVAPLLSADVLGMRANSIEQINGNPGTTQKRIKAEIFYADYLLLHLVSRIFAAARNLGDEDKKFFRFWIGQELERFTSGPEPLFTISPEPLKYFKGGGLPEYLAWIDLGGNFVPTRDLTR